MDAIFLLIAAGFFGLSVVVVERAFARTKT